MLKISTAIINGGKNQETFHGMSSHQCNRAQTHEWLTPPYILNALGAFDLDPCAASVRPWPTARTHYTFEDDGLLKEWFGRVWLNPPYGTLINDWLRLMVMHGNGIVLTFARTETRTFFRYVWPAADAVLFIKGRLSFHRSDGSRAAHNSGAPSVLIAYGKGNADVLSTCAIEGRFVRVKETA